jgi:hypothetical protein
MGTFKTSVGFQRAFRAARQRVTVLVVGNFRFPSPNTPDAWNPPSITQVPDRCHAACRGTFEPARVIVAIAQANSARATTNTAPPSQPAGTTAVELDSRSTAVRSRETAIDALIADGMRWSAQTEAAMTHGGGGQDRGEVTVLLYRALAKSEFGHRATQA